MTLLTATVQHGSSSILRRLGGADLMAEGEPLPVITIRNITAKWKCCGSIPANPIPVTLLLLRM